MSKRAVGRNSLFREIQLQIRNYIVENRLQPGDMLPPAAELADRLGVSSATLREAFRALEALGILTTKHGIGTFIRAYDLSPILDNLSFSLLFASDNLCKLVQIREALEVGLIPAVVAHIEDADIAELETLLAKMGEDDHSGQALEIAFHRTLYRCLDNDLVPYFLDIFWVVQRDLASRSVIFDTDWRTRQDTHVPIVTAVKTRDEAAAIQAIHDHFAGIKEQLQQVRTQEADRHDSL